jgi:hypothetical protein
VNFGPSGPRSHGRVGGFGPLRALSCVGAHLPQDKGVQLPTYSYRRRLTCDHCHHYDLTTALVPKGASAGISGKTCDACIGAGVGTHCHYDESLDSYIRFGTGDRIPRWAAVYSSAVAQGGAGNYPLPPAGDTTIN